MKKMVLVLYLMLCSCIYANTAMATFHVDTETMCKFIVVSPKYSNTHYIYINSGDGKWWVYDPTGKADKEKDPQKAMKNMIKDLSLGYVTAVTAHDDLVMELRSDIKLANECHMDNSEYRIVDKIQIKSCMVSLKNPNDEKIEYYTLINFKDQDWRKEFHTLNEIHAEHPEYIIEIKPMYFFTIEKKSRYEHSSSDDLKESFTGLLDMLLFKDHHIESISRDLEKTKKTLADNRATINKIVMDAIEADKKSMTTQ